MAKTTIGRGQFSGKLGGDVFAIRNGQQIVRAYQPIVSNPKTEGQNMQRAKMNLVGRFSQIVPKGCLLGLGNSAISRRSRFLQLQMRNTTAGYAAGSTNIVAKLEPQDVIWSEGAIVPTAAITAATAAERSVSITISRIDGVSDADAAASGLMVIGVVMTTNGLYESVIFNAVSTPTTSTSFNLLHQKEGAYECNIYAVPFSNIDGNALRTITGELVGNGADLTAMLAVGMGANPISWGRSVFYATASYAPVP